MKHRHTRYFILSNSRGATLVLVAILMTVLIGFAALAIDIGYVATTRNELQNISDAAALAAAGKLGEIYMDEGSYNHDTDYELIEDIAQEVGLLNQAAGLSIAIAGPDIIIGSWSSGSGFTSITDDPDPDPDAVRVIVRRDDSLNGNGNIATFFARVFGKGSVAVMADAVAALTGPAVIDPGVLKLPVGLSEHQFPDNCTEPITFGSSSCAGWHNFDDPINGVDLARRLIAMIVAHPDGVDWLKTYKDENIGTPEYVDKYPNINIPPVGDDDSPGVTSGETIFNFQNGVITKVFNSDFNNPAPIVALFDFWKERDGDGDDAVWTTTVPVYADQPDGCMSPGPTGPLLIVGQADIVVTQINGTPDKSIDAVIDCNYKALRGGGAWGGTIGVIPNLVE